MRMQGLPFTKGRPYYRVAISTTDPSKPLVLRQLVNVGHGINQALDVVDVSTWTGDASNASFIAGQLRLLLETIREATQSLKGPGHRQSWVEDPVDPMVRILLGDVQA